MTYWRRFLSCRAQGEQPCIEHPGGAGAGGGSPTGAQRAALTRRNRFLVTLPLTPASACACSSDAEGVLEAPERIAAHAAALTLCPHPAGAAPPPHLRLAGHDGCMLMNVARHPVLLEQRQDVLLAHDLDTRAARVVSGGRSSVCGLCWDFWAATRAARLPDRPVSGQVPAIAAAVPGPPGSHG
jgi:hypothetical protein